MYLDTYLKNCASTRDIIIEGRKIISIVEEIINFIHVRKSTMLKWYCNCEMPQLHEQNKKRTFSTDHQF